jgi:hypothetical protein
MKRVLWHTLSFTIALAIICTGALALQRVDQLLHPMQACADVSYHWSDTP